MRGRLSIPLVIPFLREFDELMSLPQVVGSGPLTIPFMTAKQTQEEGRFQVHVQWVETEKPLATDTLR